MTSLIALSISCPKLAMDSMLRILRLQQRYWPMGSLNFIRQAEMLESTYDIAEWKEAESDQA
jgi:hypothetical protein